MKRLKPSLGLHLIVALALSLVINFSYLLVPIITDQGVNQRGDVTLESEHSEGVLHLSPDMYGYIICDCPESDSTYVSTWQVRTFKLQEGDRLKFTTKSPRGGEMSGYEGANERLDEVVMRNGEEFSLDVIYDRPSRTMEFVWQIVYYALISYLLITLFVLARRREGRALWHYCAYALLIVVVSIVAIYLAPVMSFRDGAMRIVFFFEGHIHDNAYLVVLTKTLFMLVVSALYAFVYTLMQQRQQIVIENEQLKTENLSTRYNMLMGQINPHFFFNSLNSLAMLVREKDDERALKYIDQLSYTFRYIIQNGQCGVTTLREELEFGEAYIYLFKIRYEDKLFFDIDIDEKYREWMLPALSLQPLIGNTVKHNTITTKNPLHVTIRVVDGVLEIENEKHPKLDTEPSTGIGLSNLSSRWEIVIGKPIEVVEDDKRFMVRLPLDEPKA
ncbi:MAG: histidine kinase [Alistipes sp.]|nr:histidine kinase [Alistipes sp.]